jgi:predicted nucleic acid-binding protein
MLFIDTDVAIDITHGLVTLEQITALVGTDDRIAIAAPTVFELYFGLYEMEVRKTRKVSQAKIQEERQGIEKICRALVHVPFDHLAAEKSASIFHELVAKGLEIDPFDCMIAAVVLCQGNASLLTHNTDHFNRIAGLNLQSAGC